MSKSDKADTPAPSRDLPGPSPMPRLPPASAAEPAVGQAGHEAKSRRHRLSIASLALLLFAVITAACGQVTLKHAMQLATARASASRGSLLMIAVSSPWLWLGLAVFAISAVAWLAALSRVPLSVAYPFNALGYLVILAASVVVLHERATVLTWIGSLLVVSGLIIVVLSQGS
jgi:drug/metabolite transporter (DMT)-like permease